VTGCLDVYRTPRLTDAVQRSMSEGRLRHLIDLSEVWAADATIVRELIRLHKVILAPGRLAVAAPPGAAAWQLLRVTRADRILEVFDAFADAEHSLRREAHGGWSLPPQP
jgi:anti-anti-sigma regulatory factor